MHKKTKNSPFPPGRGSGGWGQKSKLKARSASEAENSFKSPPAHPCPLRALAPQAQPMPLPAQPRGCKGRSPLHKKTKKSPPSPEGKGAGGMGEKEKGQGGGGERQSRQAPQRIPERQSHPATTRASSPQGATVARSASAARVQARGCKGRSPLHKKTQKSPPSPEGKSALRARAGGWGKESKLKAGASRRQGRQAPPCGHHSGTVSRQPTGQAPVGYLFRRVSPCCLRLSPGDAMGEAPCIRNPKVSPFPPGRALCERGRGDGGKGY